MSPKFLDFMKFVSSQPLGGFQGGQQLRSTVKRPSSLSPGLQTKRTRRSKEVPQTDILSSFAKNILFLRRGFQSRSVNLAANVSSLLIDSVYVAVCMILNPSSSPSGLQPSEQGNWDMIAAVGAGNNQVNPLGVANYLDYHLFMNIISITGRWSFFLQTQDPVTLAWTDVGLLWDAVDNTDTDLYAPLLQLGTPLNIALRWNMDVAGAISFSLGYAAKEFLGGSSTGASQNLFIGSNDGVSLVSGYPIQPGESITLITDEGVKVWGISQSVMAVKVFEF